MKRTRRIASLATGVVVTTAAVMVGLASPASAVGLTFTFPQGGSCSGSGTGTSTQTVVNNSTCGQVRAYGYQYNGGGTGTNIYGSWLPQQSTASGNPLTSHGGQGRYVSGTSYVTSNLTRF
jgi:hypothetical protein